MGKHVSHYGRAELRARARERKQRRRWYALNRGRAPKGPVS